MAVQDQGPLLLNVVSNFQPVTSRFGGAFCPRGTEEHSLFTNRGINAQTQFIMKQKHEGIRFIINSVPALKTVRENTAAAALFEDVTHDCCDLFDLFALDCERRKLLV